MPRGRLRLDRVVRRSPTWTRVCARSSPAPSWRGRRSLDAGPNCQRKGHAFLVSSFRPNNPLFFLGGGRFPSHCNPRPYPLAEINFSLRKTDTTLNIPGSDQVGKVPSLGPPGVPMGLTRRSSCVTVWQQWRETDAWGLRTASWSVMESFWIQSLAF